MFSFNYLIYFSSFLLFSCLPSSFLSPSSNSLTYFPSFLLFPFLPSLLSIPFLLFLSLIAPLCLPSSLYDFFLSFSTFLSFFILILLSSLPSISNFALISTFLDFSQFSFPPFLSTFFYYFRFFSVSLPLPSLLTIRFFFICFPSAFPSIFLSWLYFIHLFIHSLLDLSFPSLLFVPPFTNSFFLHPFLPFSLIHSSLSPFSSVTPVFFSFLSHRRRFSE